MELPTELRHVYRALLRAASYLPDSSARQYIHGDVVHRFRDISHKLSLRAAKGLPTEALISRYHGSAHIASLRRKVNQVERACHGSTPDLKKVLLSTYGRVGKRRRELMDQILLPDEDQQPQDDTQLSKIIEGFITDLPQRFPKDSKFHVLLKSQAKCAAVPLRDKDLRPMIPAENIWGRPTPLKLVANLKKKWWANTLALVSPPVPESEWDRLRDLATGAIPIEDPPVRRTPPKGFTSLKEEENDLRLLEYFTVPIAKQKKDLTDVTVDEAGVFCWKSSRPVLKLDRNVNKFDQRTMRRLYADIWSMTPTLSQDTSTKKWTTHWGRGISAATSGRVTAASLADLELFEGLDEAPSSKLKPMKTKDKIGRALRVKTPSDYHNLKKGYTDGVLVFGNM